MVKEIHGPDGSPVIEKESVAVPSPPQEEAPPANYIVGPNDVLFVNVYNRPELGSMGNSVGASGNKLEGSRVDGSGKIQLPIVGSIKVDGLTLEQIQDKLSDAFRPYLKEPWVIVEISEFKSKPLYLLGQFRNPGTFYMDRPLNVSQGISLGNGLDLSANLRGARIIRDGKTLPVDLLRLLREGDVSQNIWLKSGDTIYIPDNKDQNVFVIGAVKRPGQVPLINGRLTLPQALSAAGFDETLSYDGGIRIIRSLSPTRGELIVVDIKRMLNGEALAYNLTDGDIVYVSKSAIGDWNVALSEILPTLQAVSAVLNPFVQIKYLRR